MHVVKIILPANFTPDQWEEAKRLKDDLRANKMHGIVICHPDYQAVDVQALTVKS